MLFSCSFKYFGLNLIQNMENCIFKLYNFNN